MDLDGDGRIGGPLMRSPNFQQYGGPYPPAPNQYGGAYPPPNFNQAGGGGLIKELERTTNIDLDGDGRIGGPPMRPPNFQQYGGPYPPAPNQYGGAYPPPNFNQAGGRLDKGTGKNYKYRSRW